jgi:hypothetical protein
MIQVGLDVIEAGYEDDAMAWAMCQVYLKTYRLRVCFSGVFAQQDSGLHSALREAHTALLSRWVGSRISMKVCLAALYVTYQGVKEKNGT